METKQDSRAHLRTTAWWRGAWPSAGSGLHRSTSADGMCTRMPSLIYPSFAGPRIALRTRWSRICGGAGFWMTRWYYGAANSDAPYTARAAFPRKTTDGIIIRVASRYGWQAGALKPGSSTEKLTVFGSTWGKNQRTG